MNYQKNPSKGINAFKDDPRVIERQVNKYWGEKMPRNNGLISKSLYDRVLYMYSYTDLHVVQFAELTSCLPSLRKTLTSVFESRLNVSHINCVMEKCMSGRRRNFAGEKCSNVRRADVPDNVVSFIVRHNKWYYCIAVNEALQRLRHERPRLALPDCTGDL